MRWFNPLILLLVTVPVTVSACEGDCIVGITNAWIGNFSSPVERVLMNIASDISSFLPSHPAPDTAREFLDPISNAYMGQAYNGMEEAIFPSYFHGKCLVNGVEPDGCPNPDCPVVCGTPGSLVHFFSKLRYIAYNQTQNFMHEITTPGSDTYKKVEQNVLAAHSKTSRSIRIYSRAGPFGTVPMLLTRREEDAKTKLKQTMAKIPSWLEYICGGEHGDTNGLPDCSWEGAMKQYILSFP